MDRLILLVEGQTEEDFVKEVLRNHLVTKGFSMVSPKLLGSARSREKRGGIKPWPAVSRDIIRHLKEDPGCIVTTMVDLYLLEKSWPGREQSGKLRGEQKAELIEKSLHEDLERHIGNHSRRFVPFVLVHEFEGLLFSDCAAFSHGISRQDLAESFQKIRKDFTTPKGH